MHLKIHDGKIKVIFAFGETLMCWKRKLVIPVHHIEQLTLERPRYGRTSIALSFFSYQTAPLTHLIKIGTQNGAEGTEFWYVFGDPESKFLTLILKEGKYKKIVLEFPPATNIEEMIQELGISSKVV